MPFSQELINKLPTQLLYFWSVIHFLDSVCPSTRLSIKELTLDFLVNFIVSLSPTHCQQLACRRCRRVLEGFCHQPEHRALFRYLTEVLLFVPNDGKDECTKIPNTRVTARLFTANPEETEKALITRRLPPVLRSPIAQAPRQTPIKREREEEAIRCGGDSGRTRRRGWEGGVSSVEGLPLGESVVDPCLQHRLSGDAPCLLFEKGSCPSVSIIATSSSSSSSSLLASPPGLRRFDAPPVSTTTTTTTTTSVNYYCPFTSPSPNLSSFTPYVTPQTSSSVETDVEEANNYAEQPPKLRISRQGWKNIGRDSSDFDEDL